MKRSIVNNREKKKPGTIGDLLENVEKRTIPVVSEWFSVNKMVETLAESHHSRIIYVVDDDERLTGIITLGDLIRRAFFLYHKPDADNHAFLQMTVTKTAVDLMHKEPVYAVVSDKVEEVLERMIEHNVKEMAVVIDEGKIVGDITMVDMLIYFKRLEMLELPEGS